MQSQQERDQRKKHSEARKADEVQKQLIDAIMVSPSVNLDINFC